MEAVSVLDDRKPGAVYCHRGRLLVGLGRRWRRTWSLSPLDGSTVPVPTAAFKSEQLHPKVTTLHFFSSIGDSTIDLSQEQNNRLGTFEKVLHDIQT